MKKILTNKLYLASLTADLISNLGDTLYYLAFANYILLLPASQTPLALTLVGLSELIPMLTPLVTGDMADRTQKKVEMIMSTQVFRALAFLLIGFLMNFEPALYLVGLVAFINLICDLAGQFENSLYIPLAMDIVSNEDRETAMGFRQSLTSGTRIGFLAMGGLLIGWLTYAQMAFLNAATFALAFGVMALVAKPLKALVQAPQASSQEESFIKRLKSMATGVKDYPQVWQAVLLLSFTNGCFAMMELFFTLTLKLSPSFVLVSPSFSIALLPIVTTTAGILGSLLSLTPWLKNLSIQVELGLGLIGAVAMYLGLLLINPYLFFAGIAFGSLMSSAVGPKFSAFIMNTLPRENLALSISGLNTSLTLGIVILGTLASLAINAIPLTYLNLLFLVLSAVGVWYALVKTHE